MTTARGTAAELRALIAQASVELARLEAAPQDDWPFGEVIQYKRQFGQRVEQTYQYVAIKIADAPNPSRPWFISGKTGQWASWEELHKILASEYTWDIWWASEWTEMEF